VIVAKLEHIAHQAAVSSRLRKALDFLQQLGDRVLSDGRVDIDGSEVYALVQSYTSRPEGESPRFEAHHRYVDVQYLVSGVEAMGWAPLAQLAVTVPYNAERDVLLGTVAPQERTLVRFAAGQAIVLYPDDAHAPGLAAGAPEPVKKIVVKVLLDTEGKPR
jgi:biofilm protein TabA